MATAALAPSGAGAQSRPPLTRIAFGSCADQARPQPIWDAVLAYRPNLFIFTGDNVYGDFSSADGANLRRAYDLASGIAGYSPCHGVCGRVAGGGRVQDHGTRRAGTCGRH